MNKDSIFFFCGIGGSGMLPLALIMKAMGYEVRGSDRSRDQGRTPEKFADIEAQGIHLFPQDGSGVTDDISKIVISSAVEDSVPDFKTAKDKEIPLILRAELLAQLSNHAATSICVAGTSGKSTTTGMIGWILAATGRSPTIMNGAVMKNFIRPDFPLASAVKGDADVFVTETDESDGSISMFSPTIAVLNNIAHDHKPMPELRQLFGDFVHRADTAIINLDNDESAHVAERVLAANLCTFSLRDATATLLATDIVYEQTGTRFAVTHTPSSQRHVVALQLPGDHNVSNALAALGAAMAAGVPLADAVAALGAFTGIRRRLELVGSAGGVTVIDDFAQNPDKITASLRTLHRFPGRLLVMFQPHGFGMLANHADEFAETFIKALAPDDVIIMPDPLYLGGTVKNKISSTVLTDTIAAAGRNALFFAERATCGDKILAMARPGDRIVVMGARDDTLPQFARDLLSSLEQPAAAQA
jgi:UDP-N-acetylmuramate--alanine ligase